MKLLVDYSPYERVKLGGNYFYLLPEEFAGKVLNGEMLEATSFNDWFYGTSYDSLRSDCPNIGVFNPDGIRAMSGMPDIDVTIFKIACSDKSKAFASA